MPRGSTVKDLTGQIFGRLTVIGRAPRPSHWKNTRAFWQCLCECGNNVALSSHDIRSGHIASCGCLSRDIKTTHGYRPAGPPSRTYKTWVSMRQRCNNPNTTGYQYYGGRGITVCERWESFENFLADMGERPSGMTLDRFPDNDGNYEPGNCRWATAYEQTHNRRPRVRAT